MSGSAVAIHTKLQYFDDAGAPLSGGKVYFYTNDGAYSTAKDTYSDYAATTANTNPVILDSNGEATVRIVGKYDVKVYDSSDVLQHSYPDYFAGDDSLIGIDGVAAMRAQAPTNGQTYWLRYHTSEGDGGGGRFRGVTGAAASTYTDDNGVTIVPTGGDGSAAYLREDIGYVTPQMFGAVADGATDDNTAIQAAIDAHNVVYFPPGTYLTSAALALTSNHTLVGAGTSSIIKCSATVDAILIKGGYNNIYRLYLQGTAGTPIDKGIHLRGETSSCVYNRIEDVVIEHPTNGLYLDGYTDTAKPCYWNTFRSVLILKPHQHGVVTTKTGAGDSPNANKFYDLNVYSLAQAFDAAATYSGIYIDYGRFQNTYCDTHVALGTDAHSCVRVGVNQSDDEVFVNLYTETSGAVANLILESGTTDFSITNHFAASAGASLTDNSGGSYTAFNAGIYPSDLKATNGGIDAFHAGYVDFTYDEASYPQSTYRRHKYLNASPSSGTFSAGAITWNSAPTTDRNAAWSCETAGTSGTWYRFGDLYIDGAKNGFNPPSIAVGGSTTTTATVTGAELGDFVEVSFSLDLQGLTMTGYVNAADTVTIVWANNTAGAVDLASGDIKIRVRKKHTNPG
jgi:hypothetical protein